MRTSVFALSALAAVSVASSAAAGIVVSVSAPSGLGAEAEFTLVNPTTIQIRLRNISTGAPVTFSNSDQVLTGVSWDFGAVGSNVGEPTITGGSVAIGATSQSLNFSGGSFGPGADVSGEWGYGNGGSGLAFTNFISALQAGSTPFGGPNLDGPAALSGPQGGLVANPPVVAIGGLGVIRDEIVASVTLSTPVANLDFLTTNLVRFEFGSDAAFLTTPTPGAAGLLALGALAAGRRRR